MFDCRHVVAVEASEVGKCVVRYDVFSVKEVEVGACCRIPEHAEFFNHSDGIDGYLSVDGGLYYFGQSILYDGWRFDDSLEPFQMSGPSMCFAVIF